MLKNVLAIALISSVVGLALAQDAPTAPEAECADRFKAADLNNDGVLTHTEIPNAQNIPPPLTKEVLVSRKEFMSACAKTASTQAQKFDKNAAPSPHSTGQTVLPPQGQQQPQGPTGPLDTKTGGAPPESPQGQTPPGMQSAPDGSSKTIIDQQHKSQQ